MRNKILLVLGFAVAMVVAVPLVEAAAPPEVIAVVDGRDGQSNGTTLQVFGSKLNKFKTFSLNDEGGATGLSVRLIEKGKSAITLLVGDALAEGSYTLFLQPKSGDPFAAPFEVSGIPDPLRLSSVIATSTFGDAVLGTASELLNAGVRGDFTGTDVFGFGLAATTVSDRGIAIFGTSTNTSGDAIAVLGEAWGENGSGVSGTARSNVGNGIGVRAASSAPNGIALSANMTANGGAQSVALHVDHSGTLGNIARFRHQGLTVIRFDLTGKAFFDGGTQVGGADFAESVTVNAPKQQFEPGDVLVIDCDGERRFALSNAAESPLVAGIYSTKPGILGRPGQIADEAKWASTEVPLAITGIVPCKVCDEGGAIRAGDLLVSASVPGHAKKAPANPKPGTLVGKALGKLKGKRGKIEVLITIR